MQTQLVKTLHSIETAIRVTAFTFSHADKQGEIILIAVPTDNKNANEIEKIKTKLADEWKVKVSEINVSEPRAEIVVSFTVAQKLEQTFQQVKVGSNK